MNQDDPDKLKGPGGLTLRQVHELVKQSAARDKQAEKSRNVLVQKQSRWQRAIRFIWDKRK